MEILTRAAQLVLSLSILVTLHELGHFTTAKIFKMRVEKFYLFFDAWFSLYKKKIGETEWGIGWLPLGGYVKIAGMIDESMDTDQMKQPAQPWEFRSKPAWQRLIVMSAGVIVNVILGFVIYAGIAFHYGTEVLSPNSLKDGLAFNPALAQYGLESGDNILKINDKKIESINEITPMIMLRKGYKLDVRKKDGSEKVIQLPNDIDMKLFKLGAFPIAGPRGLLDTLTLVDSSKVAFQNGIRVGDKLLTMDGKPLHYFDDLQKETYLSKGKEVTLTYLHQGDTVSKSFKMDSTGLLGVGVNQILIDTAAVKTVHYSFLESIGKGWTLGIHTLSDYVHQFKFVFTKKGASSLGGFGTIGKLFPPVWDWHAFWMNTAFISIILAFMNILPIPALDGGHIVFLLYEIITGKEAPQKVLIVAQYVGIVILLGLMIYANGNDVYRWLFHKG